MGVSPYLADKSALARMHLEPVCERLEPLITQGLIAVCPVTEMELLVSAKNVADFDRICEVMLPAFTWEPVAERVWERAREVQRGLAMHGQHRAASIPDLLIAATAEHAGLTVLHYDRDFDTIAKISGQPTEWVVPPGTV